MTDHLSDARDGLMQAENWEGVRDAALQLCEHLRSLTPPAPSHDPALGELMFRQGVPAQPANPARDPRLRYADSPGIPDGSAGGSRCDEDGHAGTGWRRELGHFLSVWVCQCREVHYFIKGDDSHSLSSDEARWLGRALLDAANGRPKKEEPAGPSDEELIRWYNGASGASGRHVDGFRALWTRGRASLADELTTLRQDKATAVEIERHRLELISEASAKDQRIVELEGHLRTMPCGATHPYFPHEICALPKGHDGGHMPSGQEAARIAELEAKNAELAAKVGAWEPVVRAALVYAGIGTEFVGEHGGKIITTAHTIPDAQRPT